MSLAEQFNAEEWDMANEIIREMVRKAGASTPGCSSGGVFPEKYEMPTGVGDITIPEFERNLKIIVQAINEDCTYKDADEGKIDVVFDDRHYREQDGGLVYFDIPRLNGTRYMQSVLNILGTIPDAEHAHEYGAERFYKPETWPGLKL